jgi:hypothetical protein
MIGTRGSCVRICTSFKLITDADPVALQRWDLTRAIETPSQHHVLDEKDRLERCHDHTTIPKSETRTIQESSDLPCNILGGRLGKGNGFSFRLSALSAENRLLSCRDYWERIDHTPLVAF